MLFGSLVHRMTVGTDRHNLRWITAVRLWDRPVERMGALEDPGQGVVVLAGNGIEFVIVATSTGDGHPQHGPHCHVDQLVNEVRREFNFAGIVTFGSEGQKARRHQ